MNKKIILFLTALLIILGIGAYFFLFTKKRTLPSEIEINSNIEPGSNKAILTLADGSTITLDSNSGVLPQQVANTVSTPRGGQYKLPLPDGTMIYLNAATSIRFPIDFSKERKVELSGEAYFEVTKNPMPFKVIVNGVEVLALGTHFNINAYKDDRSVQATLLEGSIKIRNATSTRVLIPGQQALVTERIKVIKVDVDQAVAWKAGYFSFEEKDLKTIMQEISNWYNVDITYQGDITQIQYDFVGKLRRTMSIENLLKILNNNGLKLELQKNTRTIVVNP